MGFGEAQLKRVFPRIFSGAWSKDVEANDGKIYVMMQNVKVSHVREYASEAALESNNISEVHRMPFKCTGTGHLVYKGNIYCNKYQSNRIMKYNLKSGETASERIRDAGFNNSFPYNSGSMTDFDFAVDERGLWVIYSGPEYEGHIVIALLDPDNLNIEEKWVTTYPKTSASNTFMVCGRLYVTVHHTNGPATVNYIFDTTSNREIPVQEGAISFSGSDPEYHTMLDYSPKDSKLYAWRLSKDWDGELLTYDVHFARS